MKTVLTKSLTLTAAVMLIGLVAAYAGGGLTLQLARTSLNNVVDAAGTTQHEAGTVSNNATFFGYYSLTRQVTTGAGDILNAGALTMTIFNTNDPPETMTLEGSHSFNTGTYIGSVGAVSPLFKKHNKKFFSGDSGTGALTIQ